MRSNELLLRCYAEKKDGVWQAFCLDFDLAVQGESLDEVRKKLHNIIVDYLTDALIGEDRKHAEQLLNRRAPRWMYLKFFVMRAIHRWQKNRISSSCTFKEPLPLSPACP